MLLSEQFPQPLRFILLRPDAVQCGAGAVQRQLSCLLLIHRWATEKVIQCLPLLCKDASVVLWRICNELRVMDQPVQNAQHLSFHIPWRYAAAELSQLLLCRRLRSLWCGLYSAVLHCSEQLCRNKRRKWADAGISLVFQYPCYHILVPLLVPIVGDTLRLKSFRYLPKRGSGEVVLVDFPHCFRLCRVRNDVSEASLIAEGQLSISHYRFVLSMDSVSSSPLMSRKRRVSLSVTMIFSASSLNNASSKDSSVSGPLRR